LSRVNNSNQKSLRQKMFWKFNLLIYRFREPEANPIKEM